MPPRPKISVVVPTYEEASNLEELTERLFATIADSDRHAELIIVDDDSNDGTLELCDQLSQRFPIRLVTRTQQRGLATAVIRGLVEATGDLIVVMDADLSHPPEAVPELLTALENGETDFVIGSRYVAGGSVDESWGLFRYINSKFATLLAAGLTQARDPMAGFFAIRHDRLISPFKLNPCGYKIGLELIVRCECEHVVEVPIRFADRCHGESKLNFREQWLYLQHLIRLYDFRYPEFSRFVRFGAVGATGLVVDLLCFRMLIPAFGFAVSRAFAIWIAMSWNYAINRRITFADSSQEASPKEYLGFCTSCLLGAGLSWSASMAMVQSSGLMADYPAAAALVGTMAGAVVNYALCRVWVFDRKKAYTSTDSGECFAPTISAGIQLTETETTARAA